MTVAAKLIATVQHTKDNNKNISRISIVMANKVVAFAKLGGKYDPTHAMKEFTKNRNKFTFTPAFANLSDEHIKTLIG